MQPGLLVKWALVTVGTKSRPGNVVLSILPSTLTFVNSEKAFKAVLFVNTSVREPQFHKVVTVRD